MSVKIMGQVWDLDLPRDEKLVLLAYADHAAHDGSSIFPAVATISKKTGYSERSVQEITRKLEAKGILEPDGHGPKGTNKWRFAGVQNLRGAEKAEGGAEPTGKGVRPTAPESSLPVKESSEDKPDILDGMQHYAQEAKDKGMDEVEALLVRLEKGLYLNLPRGVGEQSVAKWILKKEKAGESLDDWLKWLKSDEWRATHLNLYRNLSRVKTEWPQAFAKKGQSSDTSRSEDGIVRGRYV